MMLVSVGNLALSAAGKTKGFWAAKVVSVGESAVVPSWSCCCEGEGCYNSRAKGIWARSLVSQDESVMFAIGHHCKVQFDCYSSMAKGSWDSRSCQCGFILHFLRKCLIADRFAY